MKEDLTEAELYLLQLYRQADADARYLIVKSAEIAVNRKVIDFKSERRTEDNEQH